MVFNMVLKTRADIFKFQKTKKKILLCISMTYQADSDSNFQSKFLLKSKNFLNQKFL